MRQTIIKAALVSMAILTMSVGVSAYESSSATFEVHGGDMESIVGSTDHSATFKNTDAGGQVATGNATSATFGNLGGVINWLYGLFTPSYEQIHFRWRNDDGSQATATFAATEDATLTGLAQNTITRLRLEISNEGWSRGDAPVFRLEYAETATCGSGSYTEVPVTPTTEHWQIADSTNLTDAAATTNVASGLTDMGATFTAGEVKDTGNTTSAITLTSDKFTEIEYSIKATANATQSGTYCFRVTNTGATTNFVFTQYPKVVLGGLPATGTLTSTVFDSGATNGVAYNSVLWKGTLSAGTGTVRFQVATSNCANGATNAPTCDSGTWSFIGGATCASNDWYDATAPDTSVEITCAPAHSQNNKRYFRYIIELCSASNCTDVGSITPQVDDVDISWSP